MSDRPQTEPTRFEPGPATPRPSWCSGAWLRVSLDEYRQLERDGVVWVTRSHELPRDERGHARVKCSNDEMQVMRDGKPQSYGLCTSCSALELRWRARMRERTGDGRTPGGR